MLAQSVLNEMSQAKSHLLVVQLAVCQKSPAGYTINPCLVYCKRKVFLSIRLPVVQYQQCIETLAIGYPDETVLLQ